MEAPGGRFKACKECRQQKLRCGGRGDGNARCLRCRRLDLECIFISPSTKFKKQTKAELHREVDSLRQQLNQRRSRSIISGIVSPSNTSPAISPQESTAHHGERPASANGSSSRPGGRPGLAPSFPFSESLNHNVPTVKYSDTLSRNLDGLEFSAHCIDHCFALFFDRYAAYLSILDPNRSPNSYFSLSAFLFWAILWVGSRKYSKDRAIADFLASRISGVAITALSDRSAILQTIQGLLLLCNWPTPVTTMKSDLSYFLSGAAMNLAMELGLHEYRNGQDFSRVKFLQDEKETAFRANLWLHCLNTCQSRSIAEGLPPVTAFQFPDGYCESRLAPGVARPEVQFQQELQSVQAAAINTAMCNGLTSHSTGHANLLSSLIQIYDTKILELTQTSQSLLNSLHISCARLHIQSFYFFQPPDRPRREGLARLYSIAITVIETVTSLEQSGHPTEYYSTVYIRRTLVLAALCILKLSRSYLAQYLDLASGEVAYFSCVSIMKEASFQYNDLNARGATILSQLWSSQHVFRGLNGADHSLMLRVRSRLSMSIVYDCFWYWREEFGGEPSPFHPENGTAIVKARPSHPPNARLEGLDDPCSDRDRSLAEAPRMFATKATVSQIPSFGARPDTIAAETNDERVIEPGAPTTLSYLYGQDGLLLDFGFALEPWDQL